MFLWKTAALTYGWIGDRTSKKRNIFEAAINKKIYLSKMQTLFLPLKLHSEFTWLRNLRRHVPTQFEWTWLFWRCYYYIVLTDVGGWMFLTELSFRDLLLQQKTLHLTWDAVERQLCIMCIFLADTGASLQRDFNTSAQNVQSTSRLFFG